jgi:transcriptional regulator with XRE-family HTH domain
MPSAAKIGVRIRKYREELKMSLENLASKSGISLDVIDSIEKGEVIPAISVLSKLARALGQRIGTFTDDQFKPDPIITRASDLSTSPITQMESAVNGCAHYSLAFGKPDRHMDPFYIELSPGSDPYSSTDEGEELIICTKGEVELTYGTEKFILKPGDSAYYNSVVSHHIKSLGDEGATLYAVIFMPY